MSKKVLFQKNQVFFLSTDSQNGFFITLKYDKMYKKIGNLNISEAREKKCKNI